MPFQQFDRSQMILKPLRQRVHDIQVSVMIDPESPVTFQHPVLDVLADKIFLKNRQNTIRDFIFALGK
jgi:hypothetical protein